MSSGVDVYDVDRTYGCYLWRGKVGNNGRPIVWLGRKPINAYRKRYEDRYGVVADGLVLDHLCRRPLWCVNEAHLEAVTKQENELRKSIHYRLRRTRCKNGHALDEGTRLVTPEGGVLCRVCHG